MSTTQPSPGAMSAAMTIEQEKTYMERRDAGWEFAQWEGDDVLMHRVIRHAEFTEYSRTITICPDGTIAEPTP